MSRYIKADALEQHKFVSWTVPEFFDEKSLEQQAYQLGWNNAIEAIMENEPTADVVEVVHGEWTDVIEFADVECSNCHERWDWDEALRFNFCPNCGADMRGGTE